MAPQKLPEIITLQKFMKVLEKTTNMKHKLAFMLGFYQCLRVSEVACLKKEHVNKEMKLLLIKGSDISKGKKGAKRGKDRNIPIAPEVMRGLKYLPVGSDKAKDVGVRALQYAFNKATANTLGRPYNFHILRHSGATYYITKKKWNALELQRMLGHSKISTTQIYTHISPDDLVDKMWGEK